MRIKLIKSLLVLLLFLCVFDSQNLLLGIKTPVFVVIILLSFIYGMHNGKKITFNILTYALIFSVAIPFVSIIIALIGNGFDFVNFNGFIYWKSFLFLFLIFVLQITNLDLISPLVKILTLLSAVTIVLFIFAFSSNVFLNKLSVFGHHYGLLTMGYRFFGTLKYPYIYFHSTPLLVISVAYFSYQLFGLKNKNILILLGLSVNIVAMIFSGTRNNIFMSISLCIIVWLYYANWPKRIFLMVGLACILLLTLKFLIPDIQGMFSTAEKSNHVKIGHLESYIVELQDWKTLIFGQGLGSFFYTKGINRMVSNTELTYLEVIRRFGVFIGGFLIGLMYYPLLAIKKSNSDFVWLFIAYGCYLIMINFNPFFFSSTGMIILSIVLFKAEQLRVKKQI